MKKAFITATLLLAIFTLSFTLVGCNSGDNDGDGGNGGIRDNTKWFTAEELQQVGLPSFAAPVLTSDDMQTYDGYTLKYFQTASQSEFETYVAYVFGYFSQNYVDTKYGTKTIVAVSGDTTYYKIVPNTDKTAYYSTNPSPRYEIYYSTTSTLESNGYFAPTKVFYLDVRYESGEIKLSVRFAHQYYADSTLVDYFK